MKQIYLTRKRKLFLLLQCLCWLLFSSVLHAQNPIHLSWNSETGCQVYEDREKGYDELILDGICVRVCENTSVTYTLNGTDPGWQSPTWQVAGGVITAQAGNTCTVKWGLAGTGAVTATVNTPTGIQHVKTICIEIINGPRASFGLFPNLDAKTGSVCRDEILFFTNTSSPNGGSDLISYYWDFGDNTFSSAFEPSHTYTAEGNYTVTLTVRNACNCVSVRTMKIRVLSPSFEIICPGVVCEGERATYSLSDEAKELCGEFIWSVKGGTIVGDPHSFEITVDWDQVDESGFGYVTFDPKGCKTKCYTPTTIKIPVIKNKGTIKGETVVCEGQPYHYTLPQWPDTNFIWTLIDNGTGATMVITDQRNEVIIRTEHPGDIELRAVYKNELLNCGGTASLRISVLPVAYVNGPLEMCEGQQGVYSISGGYYANWVLNGPNTNLTGSGTSFSANFQFPGSYTLQVSSSDFCKPSVIVINVGALPAMPPAITGPLQMCPDTPLQYSITGNAPGVITRWEAVNGEIVGSSTGNEVTVIFNGAATSPFVLNTWNESTNSPYCRSLVRSTVIGRLVVPTVVTGNQAVCPSSYESYSVGYTAGDQYTWSIASNLGSISSGNGTPTVQVLWNQVTTTQVVDLQLTIRKCGKNYTTVYPVKILASPVFTITAPQLICRGENYAPVVSSSPALTSWQSITWDFGDGTIITNVVNPVHLYTQLNGNDTNYTVTVTVVGANGCTSTVTTTRQITVMPSPVALITPGNDFAFCTQGEINDLLTATIQTGYGSVSGIEWYYNNTLIPGTSGVYSYAPTNFGKYYAIVRNTNNCQTKTNEVNIIQSCGTSPGCTISPAPQVNVSLINNCGTITASGSFNGSPIGVSWSQSPNMTAGPQTNTSAQFTVTKAGNYSVFYFVTYTGTNGEPCTVFRQANVIVPYIPDVKYNVSCGATPGTYAVTLLDASNFYTGTSIQNWQFIVDGNTVSNGGNNQHTLSLTPGLHTVELRISGGGAPACSKTITVDLQAFPTANFSFVDYTCLDAGVHFSVANQPGMTYLWEFGDGSSNTQQNPDKKFATGGIKNVKLTVTNKYGCSTSMTKTVNVRFMSIEGYLNTPARACKGGVITLQYVNQGTVTPQNFYWMQGQTLLGTTSTGTFPVTQSGNYWVIAEDQYGCKKTNISGVNAVFASAPSVVFTGPNAVCAGQYFELSANAGPNITYIWQLNGATIPGTTLPKLAQILYYPGTYTYTVIATGSDGNGGFCSTAVSHTVTVYDVPGQPQLSFTMDNCNRYRIKLEATGSGPGTYTWSNGMQGSEIFVTEGGPYQVRFTNPSGCSTTAQFEVPKNPENYLWIFPSGCYVFCYKQSTNILIGPAASFPYWEWTLNGNIASSGSGAVAPYMVSNPGTYTLALDNGLCEKRSKPMDVILKDCQRCLFEVEIKDITVDSKPFCHYVVHMNIYNPYGYDIVVNLSAPGTGIFQPGSLLVQPGNNPYSVNFIPTTGFMGGSVNMVFEAELKKSELCQSTRKVNFPALCYSSRPVEVTEGDVVTDFDELMIVPNPVKSDTELRYHYAGKDVPQRTIEIYSIMGYLLESYSPKDAVGVWKVNLSRYPSGQYIVVMKENGVIKIQKNLAKN
ncbi:PKD domain-containing protein [Flavobacterium kingsejongi]|uniref:PKD domain-containing protein n=1 Tax=Flavobacterium kingsejongi TaxID=1678728 RepID=A0A2S1LL30_9FLAO|nr:PKD domain-containing protein [Flavobacterium kingsejongi]AWG24226.1 hypothetical protein FK004_02810 [Flavobacterium kingsejongi]